MLTDKVQQGELYVPVRGKGINNIDNLFVPFYTTKEEGSGIGLVLCRQIMMDHGGDLTIRNRCMDNGVGVEATLYLPSNKIDN